MLSLTILAVMNVAVFGGAALFVRSVLRLRKPGAVLVASALVGWVYIVLGLEVLSLAGLVKLGPALAMSAAALLGGVLAWRKVGPTAGPQPSLQDAATPGWLRATAWMAAALATGACLHFLVVGWMRPVWIASDAPIYHLYFAIRWWQAGRFELVPTPFGEGAAPYFPANGDVWLTWLLLPFGREHAAKVGQWPFLPLGGVAVYGLCRSLDIRGPAAAIAGALWAASSHALFFSGVAIVDLIMATWMLAGAFFLTLYSRSQCPGVLCLAGLALGAALGTKTVAVLFVPHLVLAGVWLIRRSQSAIRPLLFCGALLVPCGYWYARNLILTGNPLYPAHFEVFGVPVLHGWYTSDTLGRTSMYHIPTGNWRMFAAIGLRLMDPLLAPFWLGGVAFSVWSALRGRRGVGWLTLLALLQAAVFWYVNPYQTQERFLLAALGFLAVSVGALVDCRPPLAPLLVGLLAVRLSVPLADRLPGYDFRGWLGSSLGPLPAPLAGAMRQYRGLSHYWNDRLAYFYPNWEFSAGWLAVEQASGPSGCTVAYAGTNLPYYLHGVGLRNRVRYINVDDHSSFALHEYHAAHGRQLARSSTPDWDRRAPNERAWLANLRAAGVDLLFIGRTNVAGGLHNVYDRDGFPIERSWADTHGERFRLIWADPYTRVYAVRPGMAAR